MRESKNGLIFICPVCKKIKKINRWVVVKDDFWNHAVFMGCKFKELLCPICEVKKIE